MNSKLKYDIVCFGPSDWWGRNPSCTTHIMQRLAGTNRVLYVNPFSSDLSGGLKKGIGTRILRKLKSLLKVIRKSQEGLYVFSPLFFPMQGRKWIDTCNNYLLRVQFWFLCRILRINQPVIWVENLRSADMLDWFKPSLVVYHVSDLFTECRYTANREALKRREQKILATSDLIICVSNQLYQRHLELHSNVHYIPHGVDFDAFHQAAISGEILPELKNTPKPIVGYFGTMTASNDIELLLYCARKLSNVSFVFAGQITAGNYNELLSLPNVFYLGMLPYEKIPHLCASFDVCMLQWKITEWIRNCNPLKLFEYMASGKPIVSVPIREVEENYSDLISVAATKEDFCKAIVWELENDNHPRSGARIEIARQHNWDNHVQLIDKLISENLSKENNRE